MPSARNRPTALRRGMGTTTFCHHRFQRLDVPGLLGDDVVQAAVLVLEVLQALHLNLGLKLGYTGVIDNGTFNVGVGAMYQDQQVSGTVGASYKTGKTTFGLEGNVGTKDSGVQYGGLLTVSVDL